MLAFLLRWAYAHDLRLKLFNPCRSLPDRLEYAGSIPAFKIPTLDEMIASWPVPIADIDLGQGNGRHSAEPGESWSRNLYNLARLGMARAFRPVLFAANNSSLNCGLLTILIEAHDLAVEQGILGLQLACHRIAQHPKALIDIFAV